MIKLSARGAQLYAVAWLATAGIVFQLFDYWQERALRKTALFCALGGLCWVLYRWARTRRVMAPIPRLATGIMVGAAILVLGHSVARGVIVFRLSSRLGDVLHDQGQTAIRTLRLLGQGVNPYGSKTILDPLVYADQVQALARRRECGAVDQDAALRALQQYWYRDLDPNRMVSLPPAIADSPQCADLRTNFHSVGYHYGPVLLLAYLPLTALLGPAGIYATHVLALFVWVGLLCVWFRKALINVAWLPGVCAVTVFLLAPSHVNYIFLQLAGSDLIPTMLASAGLILWLQGKDIPAACLIGASIGAKLLPGLLFSPLLLRSARGSLVCAAVAAALYLPFAVWEPVGLYHNLLYPFINRDTTSPLAVLPHLAGTLLRVAAVAGIGGWTWRLATGAWPLRESLLFLVTTHLIVLVLAGKSHNNYLIWAMSAIAIFWIWQLDRSGEGGPIAQPATVGITAPG